jgi:hypothetical protein
MTILCAEDNFSTTDSHVSRSRKEEGASIFKLNTNVLTQWHRAPQGPWGTYSSICFRIIRSFIEIKYVESASLWAHVFPHSEVPAEYTIPMGVLGYHQKWNLKSVES